MNTNNAGFTPEKVPISGRKRRRQRPPQGPDDHTLITWLIGGLAMAMALGIALS